MSKPDKKPERRTLAVTVLIETTNPLLWPENLSVTSAAETETLRQLIIDALPHITRVVAVMSEEEAWMMHVAHQIAAERAGMADSSLFPPDDYVAPPDRVKH